LPVWVHDVGWEALTPVTHGAAAHYSTVLTTLGAGLAAGWGGCAVKGASFSTSAASSAGTLLTVSATAGTSTEVSLLHESCATVS